MKACENTLIAVLRAGKRLVLALVFACLPLAATAQVWRIDLGDPATDTDDMAALDVALLKTLKLGDTFDIQVDSVDSYNVRLDGTEDMGNGDRTWYGSITTTGLDYALVITIGELTSHLILTSPSGIFQLYGTSMDGVYYRGRFARLKYVRDEVASVDTVLPSDTGVDQPDTSGTPLTITQSVSENVAAVGSKLTFDLTFRNNSLSAQFDKYVDVFFILENTRIDELPNGCAILQTTDDTPVLSCELGNFMPGQARHLSFTVTTSLYSHPLVYSTALVDDVRSDIIVEIYRDVLTDTDGDGTSDYNESLLGTDPAIPGSEQTAFIDVLVAYTPEINAIYMGEVETRINHIFNVANKIFADSRAGIVLRPVGVHQVNYEPAEELFADLNLVTFQKDDSFSDLTRLRSLYGGDLVVLFRSGQVNGLCGLANLGGKGTQGDLSATYQRDFAYSVINIDCMDDSVLAHEAGHNLGLVHSRREDELGGTLAYSAGYGVDTRFVSVMAYPDDFDVVNRLYRFSDPNRACGPFVCGADKEDLQNGADAVSSLKLTKHQVEKYYPSQEERMATSTAVSTASGLVSAKIGAGAYSPDGYGFKTVFSVNETINLRMKISPLAEHIGRSYIPHMVILGGKQNLYQVTESGQVAAWNGALGTLVASGPPRILAKRALVDVIKNIDLQSVGLTDKNLKVFVAYRMLDTGELVYSVSPFSFRVTTN
jgi:hypothetical protein